MQKHPHFLPSADITIAVRPFPAGVFHSNRLHSGASHKGHSKPAELAFLPPRHHEVKLFMAGLHWYFALSRPDFFRLTLNPPATIQQMTALEED